MGQPIYPILKGQPLKRGPIGFPITSLTNYQFVLYNITEECSSHFEGMWCLHLHGWALQFPGLLLQEMVGTSCWLTHCHIPEDLNLQQHCCENHESHEMNLLEFSEGYLMVDLQLVSVSWVNRLRLCVVVHTVLCSVHYFPAHKARREWNWALNCIHCQG